jgi:hypothetical protein
MKGFTMNPKSIPWSADYKVNDDPSIMPLSRDEERRNYELAKLTLQLNLERGINKARSDQFINYYLKQYRKYFVERGTPFIEDQVLLDHFKLSHTIIKGVRVCAISPVHPSPLDAGLFHVEGFIETCRKEFALSKFYHDIESMLFVYAEIIAGKEYNEIGYELPVDYTLNLELGLFTSMPVAY